MRAFDRVQYCLPEEGKTINGSMPDNSTAWKGDESLFDDGEDKSSGESSGGGGGSAGTGGGGLVDGGGGGSGGGGGHFREPCVCPTPRADEDASPQKQEGGDRYNSGFFSTLTFWLTSVIRSTWKFVALSVSGLVAFVILAGWLFRVSKTAQGAWRRLNGLADFTGVPHEALQEVGDDEDGGGGEEGEGARGRTGSVRKLARSILRGRWFDGRRGSVNDPIFEEEKEEEEKEEEEENRDPGAVAGCESLAMTPLDNYASQKLTPAQTARIQPDVGGAAALPDSTTGTGLSVRKKVNKKTGLAK